LTGPPVDPGSDWHRLHPLSPLIRAGRGAVGLLVVFVVSFSGTSSDPWNAVGHLAALVVVGGLGFVSWLVTRWRIEGGALRIETGLIRRSSLRYPLAQIQAVDTVRPGLARLFGLSELRLRMGGSTAGSARLAYLTGMHAERLRDELLALASAAPAQESPAGATVPEPAWVHTRTLVSVPTPQLVASIALSGIGAIAIGLLVALGTTAAVAPHAARGVLSGGVVPLLGLVTGIWRRFNGDYGLSVAEAPDGLRLQSGLVETSAEVIPRGRVQAVRMVEPLLWRPLGWARLELDVAGHQQRKRENRSEGRQLRAVLPVGSRDQALALLDRIVPGAPLPGAPPPRRARLKSPLRFRHLAFARTDDCVVGCGGRLARITSWVPLAKVQSLRWSQGPLQRRLRLGDVFVDTAGRSVGAAVRDRDEVESRFELERLTELARAARRR
jgi:putative membrane protein